MKKVCFGYSSFGRGSCSVLSGDVNCDTCPFYATREQVEAARAAVDARLDALGLRRTVVVRNDVQIMTVTPINKETEAAI